MIRFVLPVIALLAATIATAQEIPAPNQSAATVGAAITAEAQPAVREWIVKQGKAAADSIPDVNLFLVRARKAIETRFAGQNIASLDVDALIMLMMLETVKAAGDDARRTLDEMERMRAEREKLRELLAKLKAIADSTADRKGSESCGLPVCLQLRSTLTTLASSQAKAGIAPVALRDAATLAELRGAVDELTAKRDSIDELSKDRQLRLQQVMERMTLYNRFMSLLLKKLSTTQGALIQNLK
jgi:hypothetical protein